MSKNSNSTSMSNHQNSKTIRYVIHRNNRRECFCQDECVLHTVSDMNNLKYGKKLLSCRNYRNHMENVYNFFKWLDDEIVHERDFKIERKNKKNLKLKKDISYTSGWLKMSIVVF